MEIIKKYNKQEQEVFPELAAQTVLALEENPEQDFLGSIFMSLKLGDEHNGQIFTPYHVCELMAEMTMDDVVKKVEQDGYISINDPCCGAGATLIAGIHTARKQLEKVNLNYQNHLLVVAQDIDETVALMCYIQLSLLGVAGYVKVGNSLTEPMTDNDNKENYWFTPMYYSNVWVLRRIFGGR
ncbi:MAG: N-6 DNA methylase [[Clostridium] scindens]